jgi:hypothetical protein
VLKTVIDRGTVSVGGRTVRQFDHSWSLFGPTTETEYRYYDGGAIRRVESLDPALGLNLPVQDYVEVPAPLLDGVAQTVVNTSVSVDVDGDSRSDTVAVVVRNTLAIEANLSVPAGDFKQLLRMQEDVDVTVTLGGTGQSATGRAQMVTWYAPGVGVVRRTYKDPGDTLAGPTVTEELAGFAVGSQRAGLLPTRLALDNIGTGVGSAVALATGADRVMTVAGAAAGTIEGAIHDANGVQIWRGTVLAATAPYRLGQPTVAFDGTNFRVVAERTIPYNSPTEHALLAQRVTAVGALLDGAAGAMLATGVVDISQTLALPKAAARAGNLLVSWGRYDTTYVEISPGLVSQKGYVVEGRLYDANNAPLAAPFSLGGGLPQALLTRDDQYLLTSVPQAGELNDLKVFAVGVDGVPVPGTPKLVASSASSKSFISMQPGAGQVWFGFREWSGPVAVSTNLRVARIGRDGALLDGTVAAPGRDLTPAGGLSSSHALAIGATRSALAWRSGYSDLRAVVFDSSLLTGSSPLPAQTTSVAVDLPGGTGPSRELLFGAEWGDALLIAWLEGPSMGGGVSERVAVTLIYPRYVGH